MLNKATNTTNLIKNDRTTVLLLYTKKIYLKKKFGTRHIFLQNIYISLSLNFCYVLLDLIIIWFLQKKSQLHSEQNKL
jgi:hypothetical protein